MKLIQTIKNIWKIEDLRKRLGITFLFILIYRFGCYVVLPGINPSDLDALKKFNRENGVTVIMISSELEELRQTCDRIAIVSGGRISGILPASSSVEDLGAMMLSNVI